MKQKIHYNEVQDAEFIEKVKDAFPVNYLSIGEIGWGGNILVAIVQFDSIDSLKSQWKQFNSFISAELLPLKRDEFSKWNFYVFYISKEADKELKYEIENNKFSSRKIVVKNCSDEIDNEFIELIIKEHITNEISVDITNERKVEKFERNATIDNALSKFKDLIKKTSEAEYFQSVLGEIEKTIRDEI